jgi:hypothetical protein
MFVTSSCRSGLPRDGGPVHHYFLCRHEQRCEMGRPAQCAWIILFFAIALAALSPVHAVAAVTANAVVFGGGDGCSNGRIDITLTNSGATRESWRATNLAGATLTQGEGPSGFASGTSTGFFPQLFVSSQPVDTLIGSYAYVGATPPGATSTAEFFVFYKCSIPLAEVLLTCFGPYGTCPQTAQEAAARLAVPRIPALGPLTLVLMAVLVAGVGGLALARRT